MREVIDHIESHFDLTSVTINQFPFLPCGRIVADIKTGDGIIVYYDMDARMVREVNAKEAAKR